jgi:hypothetical protein
MTSLVTIRYSETVLGDEAVEARARDAEDARGLPLVDARLAQDPLHARPRGGRGSVCVVQLTPMNGSAARGTLERTAQADSSLPLPVSPRISTH